MQSLEEFKSKIKEILTIKKEQEGYAYGEVPINQAVPAKDTDENSVDTGRVSGEVSRKAYTDGNSGAGCAGGMSPPNGAMGSNAQVLFQEEGEEDPDMATLDQIEQEVSDDAGEGAEDPDVAGDAPEEPQETPEEPQDNQEAPEAPPEQPQQNDNQKIQTMFKDTGQPEVDYSLSNENNIRLCKFKFTYAGINVDNLMKSDQEKKSGLTRKELESRLSPEQLHYYNDKWKKLREKFPQIPQREKNVIIHNANIMLLVDDKQSEEIPLPEPKRTEAYKKINAMMDKKFGESWQDLPEALNFLKNIKINFSKEKPVRNNLMSVKILQEKDKINGGSLIPFNKIYIDVPQSVQNFIRVNQDAGIYNSSSIYQALSSDFKEADRTVGTMDAIIKGTPTEEENADGGGDGGEGGGDEGGGSGGGGGGLGDLGGGGDMGGGDMGSDLLSGTEEEGDTGEEEATKDTSGGDEKTDTGGSEDNVL